MVQTLTTLTVCALLPNKSAYHYLPSSSYYCFWQIFILHMSRSLYHFMWHTSDVFNLTIMAVFGAYSPCYKACDPEELRALCELQLQLP